MESLNTYTVILLNTYTNEVFQYTLQNISRNNLYYEFDVKDKFNDLQAGTYELYCFWNTYSEYEIEIKSDILDSIITVNNQKFTLRDVKPEVTLLKVLDNDIKQPTYIDEKNSYIAYGN